MRSNQDVILGRMIDEVIEAYPALKETIEKGGPESEQLIAELKQMLIDGLRERGYDMDEATP